MGCMDNTRRSTFSIVIWVILGGIYIFSLWWFGGTKENLYQTLFDIVFFSISIFAWKFFFSQFILPVLTIENRKKIFQRLLNGARGPALFIENGEIVEKAGEREKKGKGVIVLDTASAVVLKKFSNFTKTAGPGVVFTEKGEGVAEAVDLHKQSDSKGPREKENPFASKEDSQSAAEYQEIQKRRFETSALTRDGIEIVPNISITFKIDAEPVKSGSGSRFGYDEEAVRKAVWHTGINPEFQVGGQYQQVNWNQTPIYLAVDLWREYLSKYKFEELFQPTQDIPVYEEETVANDNPLETPRFDGNLSEREAGIRGVIFGIYQKLNKILDALSTKCSPSTKKGGQENVKTEQEKNASKKRDLLGEKETALEAIRRMINQRLKEPYFDSVNYYGQAEYGKEKSREYAFLREERGIRVLNVGIHSLRFNDKLEESIVNHWKTNWLKFAEKEKKLIEREKEMRILRGKEKAHFEYACALSKELVRSNAKNQRPVLDVLLRSTRKEIVRNNRLLSQVESEIDDIVNFLQWIGKGEDHA